MLVAWILRPQFWNIKVDLNMGFGIFSTLNGRVLGLTRKQGKVKTSEQVLSDPHLEI